MHIPDLPPDLRFERLPRDEAALRFAFEAKRAAMGPYIIERWGWDETMQMRLHADRFRDKPFHRVLHDGKAVGTVSLMCLDDCARFGEFYLFPEFQRHGVGGRILRHCLDIADALAWRRRGRPCRAVRSRRSRRP